MSEHSSKPSSAPTSSVNSESSEEHIISERVMWNRYRKYPYLLAKFTLFAVVLGVMYFCLRTVESVAFPLFLSMLIAYLLDPTIDAFEARGIKRTPAILIVLLMGLLVIAGFFAFLYPLLAGQLKGIINKFPGLLDSFEHQFLPWIQATFQMEIPPDLSEAASKYSAEIKNAAPTVLKKGGDWFGGVITQTGVVVSSLVNIVMIPIFSFYFLRDFDKMRLAAAEYVPAYSKGFVFDRLRMMDDVVGAWFRGQIQVGLILAVLYAIGLGVVFAVSGLSAFDGVALGVITGVLNVVPYLGFAIGIVLSVLVVLIEWTGAGALIGVLAVFLVVQVAEGYYITPRVVGEKVGLSPVTVIIVLLLGGEIGGLLGILLAIPVAGAIKVILPDMALYYRKSIYFTGGFTKDPVMQEVIKEATTGVEDEDDNVRDQLQHDLGLDDPVKERSANVESAQEAAQSDDKDDDKGDDEGASPNA